MRTIAILSIVVAGCGMTGAPPVTEPDAARVDAGVDASAMDAGSDAGLDASADDVGSDTSDDGGGDASDDGGGDAFVPDACSFIGPNAPDSGIARTSLDAGSASATPIAPFTRCAITIASDTIEGHEHDPDCFPIPYPFEPPSAGPHYAIWAAWDTYDASIPWGHLVHNLEHGGVILAYHCQNDADCNAVRAEFASIIAAYPIDDCTTRSPTAPLFVVVPDPTLPVPIAAIAWQHVYEATCLDRPSLEAFVAAHYNMGPENFFYTFPDGGACLL